MICVPVLAPLVQIMTLASPTFMRRLLMGTSITSSSIVQSHHVFASIVFVGFAFAVAAVVTTIILLPMSYHDLYYFPFSDDDCDEYH